MKEVKIALQRLSNLSTCKLVLITSANDSFCSGIDFTSLIHASAEKRKSNAHDLSIVLR